MSRARGRFETNDLYALVFAGISLLFFTLLAEIWPPFWWVGDRHASSTASSTRSSTTGWCTGASASGRSRAMAISSGSSRPIGSITR